jgi:hypothetical protein
MESKEREREKIEEERRRNNKYIMILLVYDYMANHGDIDQGTKKIFCGYWMTFGEWEDIHGYTINEKLEETATE